MNKFTSVLVLALLLFSQIVFSDQCVLVTTSTCYNFQEGFDLNKYVSKLHFTSDRNITDTAPILYTEVNTVLNSCTSQYFPQNVNKLYDPSGVNVTPALYEFSIGELRQMAYSKINK